MGKVRSCSGSKQVGRYLSRECGLKQISISTLGVGIEGGTMYHVPFKISVDVDSQHTLSYMNVCICTYSYPNANR